MLPLHRITSPRWFLLWIVSASLILTAWTGVPGTENPDLWQALLKEGGPILAFGLIIWQKLSILDTHVAANKEKLNLVLFRLEKVEGGES